MLITHHSRLPQSLSAHSEQDEDHKESLIRGLPYGGLASNGATFEMPPWETFKTEK